jgi:hypothetical protein
MDMSLVIALSMKNNNKRIKFSTGKMAYFSVTLSDIKYFY